LKFKLVVCNKHKMLTINSTAHIIVHIHQFTSSTSQNNYSTKQHAAHGLRNSADSIATQTSSMMIYKPIKLGQTDLIFTACLHCEQCTAMY